MHNLGKIVVLILLTHFVALAQTFSLTLQSTKTKVYVGEPFELRLFFKEKNDALPVDSEFFEPEFQGFWLKNKSKPKKVKEEKFSTTTIVYTLAAQREGALKISKAEIKIATSEEVRDKWGALSPKKQWKTYPSNEINIQALALPSGVDLVGDFSISLKVPKKEVDALKALSITLEVKSNGNLEDIKSFQPSLDAVSTIAKEIVIQGDTLTQEIIFIGGNDFTIPSFTLEFFNPQTKKVQRVATKKISIKVNNAKAKEALIIKSEEEIPATPLSENTFFSYWMLGVYILGLASGILLMLLKPWSFTAKKQSATLKQPKILLIKLLPYIKDAEVQNIIDVLEKKIYSDASVKLDKKTLKELIEKYDI